MTFKLNNDLTVRFKIDKDISLESKIECMLFQPIVENAIIHGLGPMDANRKLTISFKQKRDLLIGTVRDNGIGREAAFKKKRKHESWATKSIEERIKIFNELNGRKIKYKFTDLIKNDQPNGSHVRLIIPLSIALTK